MNTLIATFAARLANAATVEGVKAIRGEMVDAGFSPRMADEEVLHREEAEAFAAKKAAAQVAMAAQERRRAAVGLAAYAKAQFEIEVRESAHITYGPN